MQMNFITSPAKSCILLIASVVVSLMLLKVVTNSSSTASLHVSRELSEDSRETSLAGFDQVIC